MKDSEPVEMVHEWSGEVSRLLPASGSEGKTQTALRSELETRLKCPVVWADTGRAAGGFRYYLTDADLLQMNSRLSSKPRDFPHQVRVKILTNSPSRKTQTLQVTISAEQTEFINVYRVENNRVQPLKWMRYRYIELFARRMLYAPIFLVISAIFWRWILRRVFFKV